MRLKKAIKLLITGGCDDESHYNYLAEQGTTEPERFKATGMKGVSKSEKEESLNFCIEQAKEWRIIKKD